MAIIAQIIVPRTIRISIDANGKFRNPNCIGVNARFAMILIINGSTTINGSRDDPVNARINTAPNDTNIITYNTLHTGPNIHDGGAHVGFTSSA
jgi:hypothetical protein